VKETMMDTLRRLFPPLLAAVPLFFFFGIFAGPAAANEPPVIGLDPLVNFESLHFTDVETPAVIALTPATDADDDELQPRIETPPEFGELFQYDPDGALGSPIVDPDTPVTDSAGFRVIYVPTLRSAANGDTFTAVWNDGTDDSVNKEILRVLVFAIPEPVNRPPVIGTNPFEDVESAYFTDEETPITIELTPGNDADGDELRTRISTLPEIGSLFQYDDGEPGTPITQPDTLVTDFANLRVIYVPVQRSEPYEDQFTVIMNDGEDDSLNREIVRIRSVAQNATPEIVSAPTDTTAFVGEPYAYIVRATDEDKDHDGPGLIFSAPRGPGFLAIENNGDGTAVLGGTPTPGDVGPHDVTVRVADPLGAFAEQSFLLIVVPPEVFGFNAAANNNQIEADTTWAYDKVVISAGAGNPFRFVTIPPGVTLTVAAGTTVEFEDNMGLVVAGGLVAEGTVEKPVVFRGEGWGGILFQSAGEPSRLEFATVTGVKGTFSGALSVIDTDDLTVRKSKITENEGVQGGGIYILNSAPLIEDNEITNNKHSSRGGGIYVGGGAPEIVGNLIAGNTDNVQGGGLFLTDSDAVLRNNRITGNGAQLGGGLYAMNSSPAMDNLLVANNTASLNGGGLLFVGSSPVVRNATIAFNLSPEGPGLHLTGSSPALTGSILYGNRLMDEEGADGGEARQIFLADGGSAPTIQFSNVEGGAEGIAGAPFSGTYSNNLDVDPAFFTAPETAGNESGGNYSLTAKSPLVNAGPTDAGDLPDTDIEGAERVFNGVRADMGAFEFPNNPPTLPAESFALPGTDEDAGRTAFTLSELAPANDPEGHPTVYELVNAPEFGVLFQVAEDGTAQQLPDTGGEPLPLGAEGRLEYQPANRSDPYVDRFTFRIRESLPDEEKELELTMVTTPTVTASVTADNERPEITSMPNTAVPVGAEYAYEIRLADADQNDSTETLRTTVEIAPDWLALIPDEAGIPVLVGAPTFADVGEYSITLRVTDAKDAFTEQSFGLVVDPQGVLLAGAGPDRTGAPGVPLFFEAAGEGGDPLTYAWTVIDAGGAELKTGAGEKFSWTPEAAGLFSVVVTVTDERGSVPAEDRVEVAVGTGFEAVDENRREPPTAEQAAAIAGLRNLDPATLDPDAAAATAAEAAKLDLSPGQRSDVLAGMAAIVGADGNPPAERIGRLLGAADNLVVDGVGDPADFLTPEQVDQSLNVLQALVDAPELDRPGMFKMVETLDEIVAQGGESALTNDQIGRVGEILETTADRAVVSGGSVTVTGFANLALDVRPLDLSNPTVPVSLGGSPPEDAQLTLPPTLLAELRDRYGITSATGRFTANGVTAGRGVLVNAALVGPDGSELSIDGLSASAEVTLPMTVDDRERPLAFDPAAGEWTDRNLSGARKLDDGAVTFESGRLNRFALFEAASNPLTGEDRSDTEKVVDAIEDLGSGSGCFLGTFFK
jgi:hypothetical protein